jgi:hypothetical protein
MIKWMRHMISMKRKNNVSHEHRNKEAIIKKSINKEMGSWIHVTHDMNQGQVFAHAVMNLHVPQNAANFASSSATTSFSRGTMLH